MKTKTAVLGALLSALWTATTLAAATFTIARLTDTTGCSREPSSSGNGKRVAFASEADLVTGGNMDGNFEIFVRDQKTGIAQITTSTGGENGAPSISKSGARIAFVSNRDLVTGGNADLNSEIFRFDKKKGLTQITTTTGGANGDPASNASGALIAFSSDRDLVPGGNADAIQEIFLFDQKKGMKQITNTLQPSFDPVISNNGARIAFASSADLVPGGNATNDTHVFLFDKKKGFRQISSGAGCSANDPAINASGTRVAFTSTCDLVPGSNTAAAAQIFLFDLKKGLTQVTHVVTSEEAPNTVEYPAIDASGKRVAFVSTADLVPGGNADRNFEIFLFDAKKGLFQITNSLGGDAGVFSGPSLSANGKRIAFELSGELTPGSNPTKGEIYIAEQH